MASSTRTPRVDKLYDSLSRYQWWQRWLRRARSGTGLEMHKRLLEASIGDLPGAGRAELNRWLWTLVADRFETAPRVLDIGCGFGATLLAWAGRDDATRAGTFVGLTLSGYQTQRATGEAKRLGLHGACTFKTQSFDDAVDGSAERLFDVVVSVETLFHAPDLLRTLSGLASTVRPGGAIVLVEDMAVDVGVKEETAARTLRDRWATTDLRTIDEYRGALSDAGFDLERDIDLTAQVDLPARASRDRRERRLHRLRRFTPVGRRVIDAFLGGIAMERLYSASLLSYRAMVATRRHL